MGEASALATDRTSLVRAAAIEIFAAVVLILAATVMPWATFKDGTSGSTTTFRGGAFGVVLVVLGLASIAMSLMSLNRPSIALRRLHLGVGCAAVIICIVLALNRISAANNVTATGPAQTSYRFASGVAFIAAATIAFTTLRRVRAG